MEITLKVKTEVLVAKATEVNYDIRQLESHFSSIQDIISRTRGYWTGTAGDKARRIFDNQKKDTAKVIKRFKEHPTDLLAMAGIYNKAEQDIASQNKELPIDAIQ